jgi:heptosyltransferase III
VKILVVRRDNIGDLVLTTPVFGALRKRFPDARIEALVNSYNAAVIEGHPDIDAIHVYTKSKHSDSRLGAWSELVKRLRQGIALRGARFDHAVLPAPGPHPRDVRLVRWLRPRHIAAFSSPGRALPGVDLPVDYAGAEGRHHVEDTFRILGAFGIEGPPPPLRIALASAPRAGGQELVIGIHVSARRPRNRWPGERFVELMRALHERLGARFCLFWSPGGENDPRHPGDDEKARLILERTRALGVEPVETVGLRQLIDGLAACDSLVCSDGGAMHLAAALRKPIVCFFGDSVASYWHPWGVPYRLLQPASRNAADITVDEALAAFLDLTQEKGSEHFFTA